MRQPRRMGRPMRAMRPVTRARSMGRDEHPRRSGPGLRRTRFAILGRLDVLGIAGLLEDDDVLPGEEFERLLEGEALGLDLRRTWSRVILCSGLMGTSGSSPRNSTRTSRPPGLSALRRALQGGLGVGALVVDVDHQDQVDLAASGSFGVGLGAADGLDVRHAGVAGVGARASGASRAGGRWRRPCPWARPGGPGGCCDSRPPRRRRRRWRPRGSSGRRASPRAALPRSRVSRKSQSAPCHDITSAIGRPM